MAGWLSDATPQAQTDIDELLDAVTDLASQRIATAGQFSPFAVAIYVDGSVQAVQPHATQVEQLEIDDQLAACWQALADLKDSLRAVAVAVSVTLPNEFRDGIQVNAEHRDGTAVGLVVRYKVSDNRIPRLETPSAYEEDPRIWTR